MLPIRIPSKKKQKRSGSVKLFPDQNLNPYANTKKPIETSSRKNITNRSDMQYKNASYMTLDSVGACCSGHGVRIKKISLLERDYAQSLEPLNRHKNSQNHSQPQIHQSTKKNSSKNPKQKCHSSKSSMMKVQNKNNFLQINTETIKKVKKQSLITTKKKMKSQYSNTNNSFKGIPNLCGNKKSQKSSKKCLYIDTEKGRDQDRERLFHEELCFQEEINGEMIEDIGSAYSCRMRKSGKKLAVRPHPSSQVFEQKQFLIREPTQRHQTPHQTHLHTIHQKPQTSQPSPQKPQAHPSSHSSHPSPFVQQLNSSSSLSLTKRLQNNQEQAIRSLKQSNTKLQQELKQTYKKYQNLIINQNKQIRCIQEKNIIEQEKIRNQMYEWRCKLGDKDKECHGLRVEMDVHIDKLNRELEAQRKQRSDQKQALVTKLTQLQHLYNSQSEQSHQYLQTISSHKSQLQKLSNEKQKYERTLKKCEQELETIQKKLEEQRIKNKKHQKQIQILKKQKQYIKDNSNIILDIVRNQIRDIEGKEGNQENQGSGRNAKEKLMAGGHGKMNVLKDWNF